MATSSHSNFNTRGLRSKLLLRSAKLSFAPPAAFVEAIARDPRYGAVLELLRGYAARSGRWQFGALQMADPGDNGTAPSVLGNILGA
jgi:hypothetical protein